MIDDPLDLLDIRRDHPDWISRPRPIVPDKLPARPRKTRKRKQGSLFYFCARVQRRADIEAFLSMTPEERGRVIRNWNLFA